MGRGMGQLLVLVKLCIHDIKTFLQLARYFDVVLCLHHVNDIVHAQVPLAHHWNLKFIINHIKKNVCHMFIRCSDGKIIYLLFEYNTLTIDDPQV
jgi:hypothetical protein